MDAPNPIFIVMICILLVMILRRIRIVRVNQTPSDIDRHTGTNDNGELVITGYMDILRKHFPGMSDIEILNQSEDDFRHIFEGALDVFAEDKNKIDELFNIQVFFDLSDKNLMVSKATPKTERGEEILEFMGKTLDKAKKHFS